MKKILIVEDEKSLRGVLSAKFIKRGFNVKVAKNGQEGLTVFKKFLPDLILLDIVMPIMDGLTMLKLLRQDPLGEKVPVIILTNLSEADKTAEALERGVFEYLIKSNWKLDEVVKLVNTRLEKK